MKTTALVFCLALGAATAAASANAMELNAVVDVTPEGSHLTTPSTQQPVYYFPVIMGYQDVGPWSAPATPPSAYNVLHQMATALASQGYLVVNRKSPPSIVLTFRWGRMAPDSDYTSFSGNYVLEDDMATLVGGVEKGTDLTPMSWGDSKRDHFARAATEPRYFIVIEAFDYTATQKKTTVPLWCARISTSAAGKTLEQAIPALVAGVVPLLGHNVRPREFPSS